MSCFELFLNRSSDKFSVLCGVRHLLSPGGEFYSADVYADRRVPVELKADPVLYGECLSGALYWNDSLRLARDAGFPDPRLVDDRALDVVDPQLVGRLAGISFYSATFRLFNISDLEDACEDYGQGVIYGGMVSEHPFNFPFDKYHVMEPGKVFPVCGNTYRMLSESRLRSSF